MVIPREPRQKLKIFKRGLRRDYTRTSQVTKAYLLGVLHDATVRKTTYRVATKSYHFAKILKQGINVLGRKSWIYKEGKTRNVFIVEFSKSLLNGMKVVSQKEKLDFIKGFFDAEGGIARSSKVRFYLYFCQKDKKVLIKLKRYLKDFGIKTGVVHNPSKKVDPNYWRFFVSSKSYEKYIKMVGSNHPEKLLLMRRRYSPRPDENQGNT